MSDVVFSKWFFIVVLSAILIITVPLLVAWFILQLGPELRLVATIAVILLWGVVAGYKDWIIARRKEEKSQKGE